MDRKFTLILLIVTFFLSISPAWAATSSVTPPAVDRVAAEEAFLEGYDFFLKNRLWDSLDRFVESHRRDTYFIDTYYMRSLVYRRLGRYPEAISTMASYLEVRRTDHRAQIILDTMKEEWEILRKTLHPADLYSHLHFEGDSLNGEMGVPVFHPLSFTGMRGIGKITSVNDVTFVPDTLGNNLWVFREGRERTLDSIAFAEPVIAIPVAPSYALLFQRSGDVTELTHGEMTQTPELKFLASLEAGVADATMVDSTLLAVADRTGQAVRFFGIPSFGETAEWRPADSGTTAKLFEPVAVEMNGPFLAVADRGNQRVYVLDSYTLSVQDDFEVPFPRDMQWGNQGELYILSENGSLYARFPVGQKTEDLIEIAIGMPNAWSITWTRSGPLVTDVSARTWWRSKLNPGNTPSLGAVSLHSPWIKTQNDVEYLMLRGAVSSVFNDLIQNQVPDTQAIWRNEVRPSRIVRISALQEGGRLFYTPSMGEGGRLLSEEIRQANDIAGVFRDLAALSRSGRPLPRALILDSRIGGTDEEILTLLGFLLQQGIRLDLWTIARPAFPLLTQISRITLGETYYSRTMETVPLSDGVEWVLSLPLPPDVVTFGYPAEATVSIFASIGAIRFMDWVPIWPSLIYQGE